MADVFEDNVLRTENIDGYEIRCVLGLWGVYAATKEDAEREARHYFAQYYSDGEYD